MQQKSVTATKKLEGMEYGATVDFEVPENCEEMAQIWGDSVGTSNAVSNAVVTLQGAIRRRIEKLHKKAKEDGKEGADKEDIQSVVTQELSGYKPGEATPKTDPVDAMLNKFDSLSEDKQNELINQLKAKAGLK